MKNIEEKKSEKKTETKIAKIKINYAARSQVAANLLKRKAPFFLLRKTFFLPNKKLVGGGFVLMTPTATATSSKNLSALKL